jgi:hypothetical protein
MASAGDITVTVRVKNDAGITVDMLQALGVCVEAASQSWAVDDQEKALASDAMRRLRVAVVGPHNEAPQ